MSHFTLNSETHQTLSSTKRLFDYMCDFNNFQHLLPQDRIKDFTCNSNQCSFGINGLLNLTIKIKNTDPKNRITYETVGMGKFDFVLHIVFLEAEKTHVLLEGSMNPLIKSMAEKPLLDLINTMALKLSALKV